MNGKEMSLTNVFRRITTVVSVVLFVLVCSMLFSLRANAAQGPVSGTTGSVTYSYDGNGKFTVSGNGAMENYANDYSRPWHTYRGEIKTIIIENGVTSIGNYAFYGCGVNSVSIPESVTYIGAYSFVAAPLIQVRIPGGTIERNAFQACGAMGTLMIGKNVTSVAQDAFAGCAALTSQGGYVMYEGSNAQWQSFRNNVAGGNDSLLQAELSFASGCGVNGDNLNWYVSGDVLTITGNGDMRGFPVYDRGGTTYSRPWHSYLSQITKIVISDGVTSIGQSAFRAMPNLTSVSIPDSVKSIGFAAFADDRKLSSLTLNAAYLGESAFINCSGITSVTIGPKVKATSISTFEGCTSIREVRISDLTAWCNIYFGGYQSSPARAAGTYAAANGQPGVKLYLNDAEVTELVIPNGIKNIPDYSFEFFTNIQKVTIPSSVTKIGDYAFYNSNNIDTVTVQGNVTYIGVGAFVGNKFSQITLPNSVEYIGPFAFAYVPIEKLSVSKGIIGTKAFLGCGNLLRVDIGADVTSIGNSAFEGCNGLSNGAGYAGVYFGGTRAGWKALCAKIGNGNECLTGNIRDYASSDVGSAVVIRDSYIGKNVIFGMYPQGANGELKDINWTVINMNEEAGTALLISRDVLGFPHYHNVLDNTPVTWENCSLRSWLNNDFYNSAFADKSVIKEYRCKAQGNARFNTVGGNDTTDKVFILSAEEIERYMPVVEDRMAKLTPYAKVTCEEPNDGALLHNVLDSSYWWVRTPGMFDYDAEIVHYTGTIMEDGLAVLNYIGGVRPCILVDINLVKNQVSLEDKTYGGDDDPINAFVDRLYNKVLLRPADKDGFELWTSELRSKKQTGAGVAYGFFISDELIRRNITNEEYIKLCYRVMLNREADQPGLENWLEHINNGMSREYILSVFTNSQEYGELCASYGINNGILTSTQPRDQNKGITFFVARCYTMVLGRAFDDDGLNGWCQSFLDAGNKRGHAENVASNGFFNSPEYLEKHTSNEEYLTALYRTFLGREPDRAGFEMWMGKLEAGVDRNEILRGFSRSNEFLEIMDSYGL